MSKSCWFALNSELPLLCFLFLASCMNPRLALLQAYPFEKLSALFAGASPAAKKPVLWSIGEPKHEAPAFLQEIINSELSGLGVYPTTAGSLELRESICRWLVRRFSLSESELSSEHNVLPVNGTREALFSFCQFLIDQSEDPLVLMPNPFYQIYEGAALLAGARPYYLNLNAASMLCNFDSVPAEIWQRCQLIYICSPGNPSGAVMPLSQLQDLLKLSQKFDFVIASDECYSEIYADENNPPPGLLQAAKSLGLSDYKNCIVFHSLSKRSSLPGMRSGFVAGDKNLIAPYKLYRSYHGCAMSPPFQKASIAAWSDEEHVKANRQLYREKFEIVVDRLSGLLDLRHSPGSFYLFPQVPGGDDESFCLQLFKNQNMTVLPGSYLSRDFQGTNPGSGRVRMALVSTIEDCLSGAERLREFLISMKEKAL